MGLVMLGVAYGGIQDLILGLFMYFSVMEDFITY